MVNVTRCSFDERGNKPNYYRGKDCIENLCKKLKESATEIINHKEKEMNNSVFGETMENVRNHRDIKLITSEKRRK